MARSGNSGKTVENKTLDLHSLILWCKKRKYLTEDPLTELGQFDTEPTFIRRAMTRDEFEAPLRGCAPHRRLLYEVSACSGLRENELRQLEPRHPDRKNCALRIDRMVDKARVARLHIPALLMERLEALVAAGEAKKLYAKVYHNQGKRPARKKPPENPLLYVPANSATMLKKDLEAAGIPFETEEGRLDFHALRTAYINFLMDVGANPKTTQSLARHSTLGMAINVYGRARQDNRRGAVEALGEMLLAAGDGRETATVGPENYRISTESRENLLFKKDATPAIARVASKLNWCRQGDVA